MATLVGALSLRMRLWSSPNDMFSTQCSRFSMVQCKRTAASFCAADACELLMKYRVSWVVAAYEPPAVNCDNTA
ncbi:MAG: hypothetical protein WAW36_00545 [Methylovulum miyakonense]